MRTLVNLSRTTLGFRSDRLLLFELDPPRTRYSDTQMTMLYRQLEEKIAAIPGVRSVSLSNIAIIGDGYSGTTFHLPGRSAQSNQERVQINSVGTDFFRTMGIPLLQGRAFTEHDTSSAPTVAVVNQALARRFFPRENPIGQIFEADSDDANGPIQIVGIAADTRYADLRAETPPIFYIPYQQQPTASHMVVEVHTATEPGTVLSQVRASVEVLDRELPMINVRTMTDQLTASLSAERIFAHLTAGFGLLALVLAGIGIYGIMTYTVSRRNQEIGLRMALGEQPASVVWMVLREALGMLAIGLVAGIGCSLALSRFVAAQLFGLRAVDTWTYVEAIALLRRLLSYPTSCRRDEPSAIDPLTTLRDESTNIAAGRQRRRSMAKRSAGLLMYRWHNRELQVFLVHPGGPFWAQKDMGAWSVSKGEYLDGEIPLDAAKREFQEETGFSAQGAFLELGTVQQSGGKVVSAWAFEGDCDPAAMVSNHCQVEWPPRSGRMIEIPEVDRGGWFSIAEGRERILKSQAPFLDRLCQMLQCAD